jgi:hypothetical protein
MFGRRYINADDTMILWYRLSEARNAAIHHLLQTEEIWQQTTEENKGEVNPLPDLDTPWLRYLKKGPSFKTASIDIIQHTYAKKWFEENKDKYSRQRMNEVCYDLFIRPLERLFGYDMPLSRNLLKSLEDMANQKILKTYILGIMQLTYPHFMKSNYILEKISKIRCHQGKTLWRTPPKTLPPIAILSNLLFQDIDSLRYDRWNEWEEDYKPPQAGDFYPGGRLFGLYVDIKEPLQRQIWRKFFAIQPSEIDETNLRCEIVLAKAEWTRQIHNQIVLQSGIQDGEQSLPQYLPPWAYYSLEKPKFILQEINLRRHKNNSDEQPMEVDEPPSQHSPSQEEKARTLFRYPIPQEAGFLPEEWNMDTVTTPLEKLHMTAAKARHRKIRKQRHTFFPDQDENRKISNEEASLDLDYISPEEYENQLDVMLKKHNAFETTPAITDWTIKDKMGQDLSPKSEPQNNPLMWNGCRQFIPEWATKPLSAKQIRKTPPMMIPRYLIHRIKEGHQYKVIPMDGVNRVQDLIIRHVTLQGVGHMLLQALTKQRLTWEDYYSKRSLLIPDHVMPDMLKTLEMMSKTILPKAELDFDTAQPTLFKTLVSSGNTDYLMDVVITSDRQGDERLVRIYQEDQQSYLKGSIVYPWLYTMTFIAHLQDVYNKYKHTKVEATTAL